MECKSFNLPCEYKLEIQYTNDINLSSKCVKDITTTSCNNFDITAF